MLSFFTLIECLVISVFIVDTEQSFRESGFCYFQLRSAEFCSDRRSFARQSQTHVSKQQTHSELKS